MQLPEA